MQQRTALVILLGFGVLGAACRDEKALTPVDLSGGPSDMGSSGGEDLAGGGGGT
jgi:hypothetical protein